MIYFFTHYGSGLLQAEFFHETQNNHLLLIIRQFILHGLED